MVADPPMGCANVFDTSLAVLMASSALSRTSWAFSGSLMV